VLQITAACITLGEAAFLTPEIDFDFIEVEELTDEQVSPLRVV
jgi:hypothetical protein